MKKKIKLIKLSLVLIMGSLFMIGSDDGGSDDKDSKGGSNPAPANPMTIYPKNPVVAKDGDLKLLPVVRENGKILEDSDEHTLYATYKVENENILTIGSQGDITGENPGETEVTVIIKDENTSKTYTNKVKIKVAVVDVSKLFLNPSVAALKKGERKEFTLTALDGDSSATLIEGQYIKFDYQKDQIDLTPRITDESSKVNVKAKQQKGYTFVTPIFEKAGIRVTGDSTLIQFTSTPQSNAPGASGGEDIDFMRIKNGSGDDLFVVHTGEDSLYFETFKYKQGKWSRQKLDVEGSRVEYPKIYKDNIGIQVIVLDDQKLYKFTSDNNGGRWTKNTILDEKLSIDSSNNIDILQVGSKTLLAFAVDADISVYDITSNTAKKLFSISNKNSDIKSLTLASNKNDEFRMVFSDENGLNYVTEQNGKYYKKEIIQSSGVKQVKLAYNKYNSPTIMYHRDNTLKEVEKTKVGWSTATISNLQFSENGLSSDALEDIRDFDFVVDRYGNSRVIVADDEKLYYIKEHGDDNSKDWRVDKVIEKDVGDYVSLTIDNKSRLKAIFQNNNTEWIKYWAEPVYVKYRDKSTKERVDDTLDITSSKVTEIK